MKEFSDIRPSSFVFGLAGARRRRAAGDQRLGLPDLPGDEYRDARAGGARTTTRGDQARGPGGMGRVIARPACPEPGVVSAFYGPLRFSRWLSAGGSKPVHRQP